MVVQFPQSVYWRHILSGIYLIRINKKYIYVGQARNIESRWINHKCLLKNNKHKNRFLQNLWNKRYEFKFSVVEYCTNKQLNKLEIFYIEKYRSSHEDNIYGCNLTRGGNSSKLSYEHKKRISLSLTGKTLSEETKKKMSLSHIGKTLSDETKKKISLKNIGNTNNSKLTYKQAKEIRDLYVTGDYTYRQLGKMFGVAYSNICYIINNKIWE